MIQVALADGTITAGQAEHLQTGRQIRNRYAHGKTMHPALPIPFAAGLVKTSLDVITLLSSPAAEVEQASDNLDDAT
jgi:hypothetical protein